MPPANDDPRIKDVLRKIEREKSLIQGAQAMRRSTNNLQVQERCDSSIRESKKNIDYLQNRLSELNLANDPKPKSGAAAAAVTAIGRSTRLDLIKYDSTQLGPRIRFMLQQLAFKLSVERQYLEGIGKMMKLYRFEGDEKSAKDAESKRIESSQKIVLLKQALKRYQDMHIDFDDEDDGDAADDDSINTPNIRRPLSGTLKISNIAIRNAAHATVARGVETYAVVKIEDQKVAPSKATRTDRWPDLIEVPVSKANELEISFFDRSGGHSVPIGIVWLRLSDIAEELRRKRIEAELAASGWVSADKAAAAQTEKQIPSMDANPSNNSVYDEWGMPTPRSAGSSAASSVYTSSRGSQKPPSSAGPAIVDSWFYLEPAGEVHLTIDFIKSNVGKKRAFDGPKGLGRHDAIRQRKENVHEMYGHKFVLHQFYNIMKCAYCGDFLKSSTGMQCQDCKFLCHQKCYTKVVTKCISKSSSDAGLEEKLNHNIPHKFDAITNISANWCCHCGYILPLGKKNSRKCTECGVMCHTQCQHLVPDFCGMSMEQANKILSEIRNAKSRQAAAKEKLIPIKQHQKMPSSPSIVEKKQNTRNRIGLEDFNFLAVLGKGNFGKVMLAEAKGSQKLYAIKVLKKEFIIENDEIESTRSEKRVFMIANKERHPFLLSLHSCFQTETRLYFVMEYISGGDLMLHIQTEQFTPRRAQFYAAEVLLALKYFHDNGVIYRDLKLDNILLGLDGHIKIADYGLCKEDMWHGSTTGTFCGTPEFMAPEILLDQKYTRAVDWWAFGVLIYQMLLGQSPFRGDDEDEIFHAIISDEPLYPVHMPPGSVSILQALLTRDPAKRLGGGEKDALEVMAHPYFRNINFDDFLHKRVEPPFVPTVSSATDTRNFDQEFTREVPRLTPVTGELTKQMQEQFRGFSYMMGNDV
ncbi:hypothetical protein CANCADRAFT_58235 [Tortispora caseinolytica NRRL Y-17796]|uniref:Protein kinase C-like 1 n=1 Tax=Tortispora caseinolytica NRRL Y-17796 TaxID=767744 RepID=A0A1E4TBY5_9ASCO|nr:hypothetical protein CANCADRAFT_58235 [Tortispora caseinolytica NRRL Y-17796]